jgi:hypothetical protein
VRLSPREREEEEEELAQVESVTYLTVAHDDISQGSQKVAIKVESIDIDSGG